MSGKSKTIRQSLAQALSPNHSVIIARGLCGTNHSPTVVRRAILGNHSTTVVRAGR